MIGVLGAMPVEVARLIEDMAITTTRTVSRRRFHRGTLRGQEVVVAEGGVGKVNAALAAEAMILTFAPSLIVNVGVAGVFTDRLGIGDIAVARDLVQYDVDSSALGDPVGYVSTVNRIDFPCAAWARDALLEAARREGFRAAAVRVASGDRFCDGPADKRLIVDTFGGEVCDMEGCAIAQVCLVNGVDFAAVRAISDAVDGVHNAEYGRFRDLAADNAARVLEAFLGNLRGGDL